MIRKYSLEMTIKMIFTHRRSIRQQMTLGILSLKCQGKAASQLL
jgi:hypothetical protein